MNISARRINSMEMKVIKSHAILTIKPTAVLLVKTIVF